MIANFKFNFITSISIIILIILLVWESLLVYFFANRSLIYQDAQISGFVRFAYVYFFLTALISISIYNQFVIKKFRYSWFVPFVYLGLCFYAFIMSENKSVNYILGFIYKPLIGISCMLTFEYLLANYNNLRSTKIVDYLYAFLFLFGSFMVCKELFSAFSDSGNFLAVNNIYYFLPVSIYWMTKNNKDLVRFVPFVALFVSLLSLKRGAIIVSFAMLSVYVLYKNNNNLLYVTFRYIIYVFIFFILLYLFDSLLFNNYILERFSTIQDGSGRSVQFQWAIWELSRVSLDVLFVGHGMGASQLKFYGQFIHNDWLLLLYDFGIIGLVIYSLIYIYLIKKIFVFNKKKSPYVSALISTFVFCIFLSNYSALTWVYIINVLSILGCIFGLEKNRLRKIELSQSFS